MDFSLVNVLICFFTGLFAGTLVSTLGIGGGIIIVPLLMLMFNLSSNDSTATSLAIVVITTFTSVIAYMLKRLLDYKTVFFFLIFTIPGSIAGSYLANYLSTRKQSIDYLQICFLAFIFCISIIKIILFFRKPKKIPPFKNSKNNHLRTIKSNRGEIFSYQVKLFPKISLGFFGGLIGSALGLGGGIIYIPILTSLLGIPYIISVSTAAITMFISNVIVLPFRANFIHWNIVFFTAVGSIISAAIIPKFIHKINSKYLYFSFWSFILIISLTLIFKTIL